MKSSGEVAAGLALIGAVASVFVYRKTSNKTTTCGLLFFVSSMCLMSFLYIYAAKNVFDHSELAISAGTCNDDALAQLDKCETFENKFLSLLSFSCFCFQPYVYHLVISEGVQSSVIKERYVAVTRLCMVSACLLMSRYFASHFVTRVNTFETEWFRGHVLCSYISSEGDLNLPVVSVPMIDSSYFAVGMSLHFFLLYAPFVICIESLELMVQWVLLLITGPLAILYATDASMERPALLSIVCFFQVLYLSIKQAVWKSSTDRSSHSTEFIMNSKRAHYSNDLDGGVSEQGGSDVSRSRSSSSSSSSSSQQHFLHQYEK